MQHPDRIERDTRIDRCAAMAEQSRTQTWWRRRRVRVSIRALMAVILVDRCGSRVGRPPRPAEREAVAVVLKAGGDVYYEDEGSKALRVAL